ncbi:MAG: triose-phosphate isomerase [Planctomycetota bacterium]|nr:triose-phosphate isomerase [Planctomycetota bacterium]MDA0932194.1 triose-phosphate isomerase [Planctomycetota bacterium]MDA1223061.1 triose-phosphate isomerase [Planctomycetota bacterium]
MNEGRKPYIAGNWKMNLDRAKALDLIKTIKGRLGDGNDREVAVFCPSVYLADVSAVAQGSPLGVGAQNLWFERDGAYTGELSSAMLREVGADRVLIGHSERRHVLLEPDDWMARKMRAALDGSLLPILCVGEKLEERKGNRTERVLKRQLEAGFSDIQAEEIRRVTIAYEPVWAIGTGETATPLQVGEVHKFIRRWVASRLGAEAGEAIRVLYGGSVNPGNVKALMSVPDVDGVLVGGASLKPDTFLPLIEFDR